MNNMYTTYRSEVRFFAILVAILGFVLFFSIYTNSANRGDNSSPAEIVMRKFPDVSLQAKAVYVYDLRNGEVIYARNEDTRMPLASLTKVMTALVARDVTTPNRIVSITEEALDVLGDNGLYKDEKWRIQDIIDFSLVASSNDGMRAVALSLGSFHNSQATTSEIIDDFVSEMNMKASALGLKNTYFWNETGLDESEVKGGAYGTARDMASLMGYVLRKYPDFFSATRELSTTLYSLDNLEHTVKNTNILVAEIPGVLGSKTGFTDTAGGNLSVIFDPEIGRPIVITVLGSTENGRFEDMRKLVGATMQYITE